MIEIRLSEALEKQSKSLYWLWKSSGVRYATLWQLSKGEVVRLNLDVFDQICEALNCQPADLIVRVDKAKRGKRKSDAQRRDRDAIVPSASPPPESSSRSPKHKQHLRQEKARKR
jgi:DNA-binding Xre family transcriptional regulator